MFSSLDLTTLKWLTSPHLVGDDTLDFHQGSLFLEGGNVVNRAVDLTLGEVCECPGLTRKRIGDNEGHKETPKTELCK